MSRSNCRVGKKCISKPYAQGVEQKDLLGNIWDINFSKYQLAYPLETNAHKE